MEKFKIYEIKKSVFNDNDRRADALRTECHREKVFLLNVMASPGAGKTTLLVKLIEMLKDRLNIGVMEADIDSSVDAEIIHKTGVKVVQLHTGGMCHLDADMTKQGMDELSTDELDMVVLENVGNLVCPAEFDTGASKSIMLLSIPEGDDKPLKYPLMFSKVDALIVTKADCREYFDFDCSKVKEAATRLNPDIKMFCTSAKSGEGMEPLAEWIYLETIAWNNS